MGGEEGKVVGRGRGWHGIEGGGCIGCGEEEEDGGEDGERGALIGEEDADEEVREDGV